MTVCLEYSQLRLANGGEDGLHPNDVIISDAAGCNQGRGCTEDERCFMPGWTGGARKRAGFICLLSPSVVEQEEKHKER